MGGYEDISLIFFFLAKLEGKERELEGVYREEGIVE